jgi:hypothetical protein
MHVILITNEGQMQDVDVPRRWVSQKLVVKHPDGQLARTFEPFRLVPETDTYIYIETAQPGNEDSDIDLSR